MVAFSSILCYSITINPCKNVPQLSKLVVSQCKGYNLLHIRNFNKSKGHVFHVVPSTYSWTKFKDMFHLYAVLGMIPVLGIVIYANVFIGSATLQPTPEGYRPKAWEYYSHPITRFIRRYLTEDPQKVYEKACFKVFYANEEALLREVEQRVKYHILDRRDFQSWYYSPAMTKYSRRRAKEFEDYESGRPSIGFPMHY